MKSAARVTALLLCLLASGWKPNSSVLTVTNVMNSGPGSLREAIVEANKRSGPDDIIFDIQSAPNAQAWWTIKLESPLPFLADSGTRIYGSSQPGWGATRHGTGGTVGADRLPFDKFPSPVIVLDANHFDGITIASNVSDILVEGFSIINADNAVVAQGITTPDRVPGKRRVIQSMFIGMLPNGQAPGARMNAGYGIVLRTSNSDLPPVELDVVRSFIGFNGLSGIQGEHPSTSLRVTRSEIMANGWATDLDDGIDLNGKQGRIIQNLIHSNRNESGTSERGSGNGIEIGSRNVSSSHNLVASNTVVDNWGDGISIVGGSAGNLIQGNEIRGNRTGITVRGEATRANQLSRNRIWENDRLGIDLVWEDEPGSAVDEFSTDGYGVTLNSPLSGTSGPNLLTGYPVIERAVASNDTLRISGFAPEGAHIEMFESDADSSGFGEGKRWLFTGIEGSVSDLDDSVGAYGPLDTSGRHTIASEELTSNRFSFRVPLTSSLLGKTDEERAPYLAGTVSVLDSDVAVDPSTPGSNTSEFGPYIPLVFLPDRVIPISPRNGATDLAAPISFSWEPAAHADAYVIEISAAYTASDDEFASVVLRDTLESTGFRTGNLRAQSTYYWHVKGLNDAGVGAWSETRTFSTSPQFHVPVRVSLAFPTNKLRGLETSVLFQWHGAESAESYEIQIARDPAFSAADMVDRAVTADSAHRSTDLAMGTTHFWRVRAHNASGTGAWSETWRFTTVSASGLGAVTLVFPDSAARFMYTETLFRWVPLDGATSYQIEIDTDSLFEDVLVDAAIVGREFYRSDRLESASQYFWRVIAQSNAGLGIWSNVWSFSTASDSVPGKIRLQYPDSGQTQIDPDVELRWLPADGVAFYDIEVATSSDFRDTQSLVQHASVAEPSFVSNSLSPDSTTYFWRVIGRGPPAGTGWSNTWVFSTGPCIGPDRVSLSSPDPGELISTAASFAWQNLGSVQYEIQVSTDSAFTDASTTQSAVTADTQWSRFSLLPAQRYFWRVRAFTDCDEGDWSVVRFVTTRDEPPLPPPPILVSPADGERNVPTIPTLILASVEPVDSFQVQLGNDDTFVNALIDTVISRPRMLVVAPLENDTTYFWRARARNSVGYSLWSLTASFTTILFKARFNESVRENRLAQNRPNPFNPSTTIEFELKNASHVVFSVFDIRGREVARLLDSEFDEGIHRVVWDGQYAGGVPAPSGVYLYRIVADDFITTKRMILIK